ncbi:MAG TPA: efflux RND transporter periplasmic adaptor subunit [Gaiellaceae bacterium]|nr:efflux RND transporter periplasmic adaptor subunit [Gaiellaceae bacterium]
MRTTWGLRARPSRRAFITLAVVAAAVVALSVWRLQGNAEAQASQSLATATRGPIVVTVGGVGQIVDGLSGQSSSGSSGPANAIFPITSGTISDVLVAPGQNVEAGQALAVIDDGGIADSAAAQAQIDLETALLELPPSARTGALGIALASVTLAKQRLALARGPASRADLRIADADVARARAELAALLRPAQAPTAEALTAARTAVRVAEQSLARLTGPPDPVAVATAEAEVKKAEADLEALVRSDRTQPVTKREIDAAKAAIEAAKARLAKLLQPDTAAISTAELELDRARAELAGLLRPAQPPSPEAVDAAEQALAAAQENRKRLRQGSTQADVTSAQLELLRARADLRTLRTAMRKASNGSGSATADVPVRLGLLKIQGAQNRLSVARAAQGQLEVTSPWSGTVSAVFVAKGARVDATTPIASVSDLDNLAVNVNLSEFDVAQVEQGMHANVSVDALGGETFSGTVEFVALAGTDTGGVITFPVRIGLGDSEGLKPGMNTSVRIVVAKKADVVRVPLEAVTTDDEDQAFVTILDESGQEVEVEVETGLETAERVEIVSGLKAGARVVLPEVAAAAEEE